MPGSEARKIFRERGEEDPDEQPVSIEGGG